MNARRIGLRAPIIASALLLSAGLAPAQDVASQHGGGGGGPSCTTRDAAGQWGYTVKGTNTTGGPDGIVGSGVVDATGNVVLTQTEVTNGQVRLSRLEGTITVNRDCTATLTGRVYESGQLVVTATWALVFVDRQNEIRGILTRLVLPSGSTVPLPVQLLNAERIFPGKSGRS